VQFAPELDQVIAPDEAHSEGDLFRA
jgi:hypothetical protein